VNDFIAGSSFTGSGGLDLGLERAGMRIAWQCEVDAACRRILKRHWPDVPCFDDIRTLCVEPAPGDSPDAGSPGSGDLGRVDAGALSVDLFSGGVPCQDVSIAGNRAGLAGARTGLFFDFARVADVVVRPGGWLIFENVPGLFSSNGGRDFGVILATLAEIGFHDLAWRVLNSRYFGVPQNRRRVFIVARRSRGSSARSVLLEPEGGGGDFEAVSQAKSKVAGTPANRSGNGGIVVNALDRGAGGADDNEAQGNQLVVAKCLTTSGQRIDTDTEDFIVPSEARVRRLTPTERERLQGFPDGWTIMPETLAANPGVPNPPPDAHRGSMTGNAVTVPVGEWIGRRILAEVGL
jgi:DNA (cytosine-5)-methyltransferase 1